jgi:hypothetical protein
MERKANSGQSSRRAPLRVYRLRCGRKVWSPWLSDLTEVWWRAHHQQLARFDYKRKRFFPGPLTWIEVGERAYAGRRTLPVRSDEHGQPLASIHMPTMPLR